ncbi:MAG: ABC transporter permease [Candidatus Cloacimonetes bacterium]|nr:ABC transporter permease [Candidatus Cloacimonadota bacterium]
MLKFLLKGIFRDRHRWFFPILIVMFSVAIMIFFSAFISGFQLSYIRQSARFSNGHAKVVSRAYAEVLDMKHYDLALMDIEEEFEKWKMRYPQLEWFERINFGALLDVPDEFGETKTQVDVIGMAVDLDEDSAEIDRLQLTQALRKGHLPQARGQILLSDLVAEKIEADLGDSITLMGSTMFGVMTLRNFEVVGTVEFGIPALDRGAVLAELEDVREMLDMQDAKSEIFCYLKDEEYDLKTVTQIANDFNSRYSDEEDEFSPLMLSLHDQGSLGSILSLYDHSQFWMSIGFIVIIGIVLWNMGLLNGIRRYSENGIRLAIGESKGQVYASLLMEALIIGIAGCVLGIALGILFCNSFNKVGMDLSLYNKSTNMMSENVLYTVLNPRAIITGSLTGLFASILGSALAGTAIYKRQISQLFKELET